MIELRQAPRITVNWRAALRLSDGRLLLVRVLNVAKEGVLVECAENLGQGKVYPMMLEIPAFNGSDEVHKVQCNGRVRHAILAGDSYKMGLHLQDISSFHAELVQAWVSLTNRGKPA